MRGTREGEGLLRNRGGRSGGRVEVGRRGRSALIGRPEKIVVHGWSHVRWESGRSLGEWTIVGRVDDEESRVCILRMTHEWNTMVAHSVSTTFNESGLFMAYDG